MVKFTPVEEVDIWQMVEYMEGKWTESSHAENGVWNFDMDYAKQFFLNMVAVTPAPHGMVAFKNGVVVGLLVGAIVPMWAESRSLVFQSMIYRADAGCGMSLMKEVENTLQKGTRFILEIQMKSAEQFERVAGRLGFIEEGRVFAKIIGETKGGN